MAKKKYHAGRTLAFFLVLVLALTGTLLVGVLTNKAKPTPSLALDLEGGTQLILTPKANAASGAKRAVTAEDITQAIEVIRQRVDASGVSATPIFWCPYPVTLRKKPWIWCASLPSCISGRCFVRLRGFPNR